ncbi:MAG: metallophosphoesterase [Clostridia bacterium]|nr:metallophosphoesterase [Clostridia bacterium]
MYKLGVISDSHANYSSLKKAAKMFGDVDAIAHLGDLVSDCEYLRVADKPVYSVAGNCDYASHSSPKEIVINIAGRKILMCHGHAYYVKLSLTRLMLRAREAGADVALYGHTHIPGVDMDRGILFVNPGALTLGSLCVIEFRENGPVPVMYRV